MAETMQRPLPTLSDLNRPFFHAAAEKRLALQRCKACGHIRFPLGPVCSKCRSPETEWATLSGRGEVLAHLVFHQAYHAAWKDKLPYSVVQVQLAEGPRLFSDLHDAPADHASADYVGRQVTVDFVTLGEGLGLPVFRLA